MSVCSLTVRLPAWQYDTKLSLPNLYKMLMHATEGRSLKEGKWRSKNIYSWSPEFQNCFQFRSESLSWNNNVSCCTCVSSPLLYLNSWQNKIITCSNIKQWTQLLTIQESWKAFKTGTLKSFHKFELQLLYLWFSRSSKNKYFTLKNML